MPILADYPQYVEPIQCEDRLEAPPVVTDGDSDLSVRAWRYWYNAHGIVETVNRLSGSATAVIVVHPWGIDDGHGLPTPSPAGAAFFCTKQKNTLALEHMRDVIRPFLDRMRGRVALVAYSMPNVEDPIRRLLYASSETTPDQLRPEEGEQKLRQALDAHEFTGQALPSALDLDADTPVHSYLANTPSTDASPARNTPRFWELPMPVATQIGHQPSDLVFYDGEGYAKVRDYLRRRGVRNVLLAGYATDMCLARTTCGYENLCQDFNVFVVGDATLATFPGSMTPKFATQVALANAALRQLITQVNWVAVAATGSD